MPTELLLVGVGIIVTVVLMGGGSWLAKVFRTKNDTTKSS